MRRGFLTKQNTKIQSKHIFPYFLHPDWFVAFSFILHGFLDLLMDKGPYMLPFK